MKNEIDWEGEAADWLVATGISSTAAERKALARFLKEAADIHADQRTERISNEMERRIREDESSLISSGHSQWHYGYVHGLREAAIHARSYISKKKTREEVLEEALRKIDSLKIDYANPPEPRSKIIAREALEWKP